MEREETFWIENEDALEFVKKIDGNSVQCIICDPPFGIQEETFDKHYARNEENVVEGYHPAPCSNEEYYKWACLWIHEFPRILKKEGSGYIICAWNHVCDIEKAIRDAPEPGLTVVNHIIWKYNFGVYTKKKFVSSHYHILRVAITNHTPIFYNLAFHDESEKNIEGRSLQYMDMEDVWYIKKEYTHGQNKNVNKLPNALIEKIVRYSTAYQDIVCDLFLGNFTTAYVSLSLGRRVIGCEINKKIVDEHLHKIKSLSFPSESETPGLKASKKPKKSGKKLSVKEKSAIQKRFEALREVKPTKKECIAVLQEEFERGYFSIVNVLKQK